MSIRQAVYEEWRREKLKSARKEKKEQELKEQEAKKKEEDVRDILDMSIDSILSLVPIFEVKLLSFLLCTLQPTLNNIDRKIWVGNFQNIVYYSYKLESCINVNLSKIFTLVSSMTSLKLILNKGTSNLAANEK